MIFNEPSNAMKQLQNAEKQGLDAETEAYRAMVSDIRSKRALLLKVNENNAAK